MSVQTRSAIFACATIIVTSGLISGGCSRPNTNYQQHGSAAERLTPVTAPLAEGLTRRTVYAPIYSSIYWGLNQSDKPMDLAATVSIRNVSSKYPLILESVRYYDSAGRLVRDYVTQPSELGALATVEFVIQQLDRAGGPGASFLIRWAGAPEMNEPLVESVMVGQSGTAGISFTSPGRVVKDEGK
ncbi:MAG: DUF3124 domain-containing protein [Bryobacteraceae bacterium]